MKQLIFFMIAMLAFAPAFAQVVDDPNKQDEALMKDEAEIRLAIWTTKVANLQRDADNVVAEIAALTAERTQLTADARRCNEEIFALLGVTDAQIQAFRERLGRVESRVREIGRMSDDQIGPLMGELDGLETQLTAMRQEKIALYPEFYNRIIEVQKEINNIRGRRSTNTYTVGTWAQDRDCLWNISAKENIYNDPFMWPKIWQANTDQIRNPDLIYPGQVLTIPPAGPKTDEELRAERLYYRRRKMGMRTVSTDRTPQVDQQDAGSGGR